MQSARSKWMRPETTIFGTSYADQGFWHLLGGSTTANTWAVAPMGEHSDLLVSSSCSMYLGMFRSNFTGAGGELNPHGIKLPNGTDVRGSPAINDTARVIASITVDQQGGDPTPMKGEYYKLRIIKYTDNGSSISINTSVSYLSKTSAMETPMLLPTSSADRLSAVLKRFPSTKPLF